MSEEIKYPSQGLAKAYVLDWSLKDNLLLLEDHRKNVLTIEMKESYKDSKIKYPNPGTNVNFFITEDMKIEFWPFNFKKKTLMGEVIHPKKVYFFGEAK